jgi:nitrite reductase/ring-hydroxylating ferredoxin subunit
MTDHVVCEADELGEGERVLVQLEGREIGVFNVDGELRAYTNWCAHQSGPICEGNITGTWEGSFDRDSLETSLEYCRDGEILNCPWHGWEYDIENGDCLSREGIKLPSHPVEVRDGEVVVSL